MCYNNSRKKAGRHTRPSYGVLAQLGERKVRNLEVRGSIPLCSTKFNEKPIEISTFQWVFCCFASPPPFHIARDDTLCSEIPCMDDPACARHPAWQASLRETPCMAS